MTVKRLYENSEKFLDTLSQVIKELKEVTEESNSNSNDREKERKTITCKDCNKKLIEKGYYKKSFYNINIGDETERK